MASHGQRRSGNPRHGWVALVRSRLVLACLALLTTTIASACIDEPCDPGQVELRGNCFDVEMPEGDAGPQDASADRTCDPDDPYSGFGWTCVDGETHSDCPCAASICAIAPGNEMGRCSQIRCLDDPDVCPSDWDCIDISAFEPEAGSLCLPPDGL